MPIVLDDNNTEHAARMIETSGVTQESFSALQNSVMYQFVIAVRAVASLFSAEEVDLDGLYDALDDLTQVADVLQGGLVCAKVGGFKF